jgi:general secretion pathway protein H
VAARPAIPSAWLVVVSRSRNHRACNGFSLVEMLVVLFVIGLLAAVVLSLPGDERTCATRRNASPRAPSRRATKRSLAARRWRWWWGRRVLLPAPRRWRVAGASRQGFDLAAWKQGAGHGRPAGRTWAHRVRYAGARQRRWRGPAERGDRHLVLRIARDGKVTLDAAWGRMRRRASPCSNLMIALAVFALAALALLKGRQHRARPIWTSACCARSWRRTWRRKS